MKSNIHKKMTWEDKFDRKYACWVDNNRKAWHCWKHKTRKDFRRKMKKMLDNFAEQGIIIIEKRGKENV